MAKDPPAPRGVAGLPVRRRRVIRSRDLGIALGRRKERELFKWFLACLLFGKPIQQEVARRAYQDATELRQERGVPDRTRLGRLRRPLEAATCRIVGAHPHRAEADDG